MEKKNDKPVHQKHDDAPADEFSAAESRAKGSGYARPSNAEAYTTSGALCGAPGGASCDGPRGGSVAAKAPDLLNDSERRANQLFLSRRVCDRYPEPVSVSVDELIGADYNPMAS